jgi:predicted CoA-binding protein
VVSIDTFFDGSRYATVGHDPADAYGAAVIQSLNTGARHAVVVWPPVPGGAASTHADEAYATLGDVPGPLDGVIFNIEHDPERMLREVQEAVRLGVPRIWIENRCEADEAVRYALDRGVEVVDNVCPLMVLDPRHIHWLHRKALDVFGKTPAVLATKEVTA